MWSTYFNKKILTFATIMLPPSRRISNFVDKNSNKVSEYHDYKNVFFTFLYWTYRKNICTIICYWYLICCTNNGILSFFKFSIFKFSKSFCITCGDMLPPLIEVGASRSRILLNPVSTSYPAMSLPLIYQVLCLGYWYLHYDLYYG